jgi:alkaline phosphatase
MTKSAARPLACVLFLALLGAERSGPARNAILFVGDGMGVSVVTAARILSQGPNGRLAMELPHTALVRTFSRDRMVSDSAATATAMLSGAKVDSGVIGMSPSTRRGCSLVHRLDGTPNPVYPCGEESVPIPSLADLAIQQGMTVGVVTTTRITHATPAALYAHVDMRGLEEDIASQLVERGDIAFIAGGGGDWFRPLRLTAEGEPVGRADGRDLFKELAAGGYAVAANGEELRRAVEGGGEKVAALLAPSHLPWELERREQDGGVPSLEELTQLAIRHLSKHPGGYLLLVEGGRIDHALHGNLAALALGEVLAFDAAIAAARRDTSEEETLVVVTADHSSPLMIAGYPLVDDSILGLARSAVGIETRDADGDRKPDFARGLDGKGLTILQFGNGPGYGSGAADAAHASLREDPLELGAAIHDPGYAQEAAVPLSLATHEGGDVIAAASGPGAERVRGFMDNTEIFAVLVEALGLQLPRSSDKETRRRSRRARSAANPIR